MRAHLARYGWLLGALALAGACADSSGPNDGSDRGDPAVLVSSSIAQAGNNAAAAMLAGQSYVSMRPGTDSLGQSVQIRNLKNGAEVTVPMLDGGFDPVAIEANAQDSLSVTVFRGDGSDTTTYRVVPIKSRPRVVRTSPPNRRTDVPLNSVIVVVFNQPMDSASLPGSLVLRQGSVVVPGTVAGEVNGGVIVIGRFTPSGSLAPLTRYDLSIKPVAQSLEGERLERDQLVQFTTGPSNGFGTLFLVVKTSGVKPDSNGYLYGLNEQPRFRIGINETKRFVHIRPGPVEIRLGEYDSSCGVAPTDRQTVSIPDGDTVTVTFTVTCYLSLYGQILFSSNRDSAGVAVGTNWWSMVSDGRFLGMQSFLNAYDEIAYDLNGSMAWTIDGNVYFYNFDCCETQLTFGGGAQTPGLSGRSWKVAYTQRVGSSDVYDLMIVTDPVNPVPTIVGSTAPDRVTRRFSPAWSRNDGALMFGTDTSINTILVDGTGEQMLVRTSGPVSHLDWSWQGGRIVFNAPPVVDPAQPTLFGTGAWVVTEGGQGLTQLMSPTAGVRWDTPRWSPKGDSLVFSRVAGGRSAIWGSRPDGSQPVELSGEGTVNVKPFWIKPSFP